MNVSAVLVTRGDVDLSEIIDSITASGIDDIILWDNSEREDLAVYGRYAAIAEAKHDWIWTQDDDCVLPPESINALLEMWDEMRALAEIEQSPDPSAFLVANQPEAFRLAFYEEHSLVGFGAAFHRDLPRKAFQKFHLGGGVGSMCKMPTQERELPCGCSFDKSFRELEYEAADIFRRTCDIVFTGLSPRVLVDVEYQDLPWAHDSNRMWKQNGHVAERTRMLELVRQVRDTV